MYSLKLGQSRYYMAVSVKPYSMIMFDLLPSHVLLSVRASEEQRNSASLLFTLSHSASLNSIRIAYTTASLIHLENV